MWIRKRILLSNGNQSVVAVVAMDEFRWFHRNPKQASSKQPITGSHQSLEQAQAGLGFYEMRRDKEFFEYEEWIQAACRPSLPWMAESFTLAVLAHCAQTIVTKPCILRYSGRLGGLQNWI